MAFSPSALVVSFLLSASALTAASPWRSLWNGKDLSGWDTYLAIPHPSAQIPGLPKKPDGQYTEPLGLGRDPLKVFAVQNVDGRPAIRISGQVSGTLSTQEVLENYHLRVQFKWGEKRWPPQENYKRDSAVFFHGHDLGYAPTRAWPRCLEFQVTETDVGDVSTVTTKAMSRGRPQPNTPAIYDPKGEPILLLTRAPHKGANNHCTKSADHEKPHGEWNTLELFCVADEAVLVVNGGMVMRVQQIQRQKGDGWESLTKGFICLQSKNAEIYYRDVEVRAITRLPAEFDGK